MNEQELLFKISNQLNQVIDLLKPQITESKPLEIIQCYCSGDHQSQEFCVGSYGVTRIVKIGEELHVYCNEKLTHVIPAKDMVYTIKQETE